MVAVVYAPSSIGQSPRVSRIKELLASARLPDNTVSTSIATQIISTDPEGVSLRAALGADESEWLSAEAINGSSSANLLLSTAWGLPHARALTPVQARELADQLYAPSSVPLDHATLRSYAPFLLPTLVADLADDGRGTQALAQLAALADYAEPGVIAALDASDLRQLALVTEWLAAHGGIRSAIALRSRLEDPETKPAQKAAWEEALARIEARTPVIRGRTTAQLRETLKQRLDKGEEPRNVQFVEDVGAWHWSDGTLVRDVQPVYMMAFDAPLPAGTVDTAPPYFVLDARSSARVATLARAWSTVAEMRSPGAHAAEGPFGARGPPPIDAALHKPGDSPLVGVSPSSETRPEPSNTVAVYYCTDRSSQALTWAWCLRGFTSVGIALALAMAFYLSWILILRTELQRFRLHVRVALALVCVGLLVSAVATFIQSLQQRHRLKDLYGDERDLSLTTKVGSELPPAHLGRCLVSVPLEEYRQVGLLNRPRLWSGEFAEDPGKHYVLLNCESLRPAEYFRAVGADSRTKERSQVLVFVHGFNVGFYDAVLRTAQLKVDLQFEGAAVLFSWPSRGSTAEYTWDESAIDWSIEHLHRLLVDLRREMPDADIHVLAHSMGNRALTAALHRFAQSLSGELAASHLRHLQEVILAAPDIDSLTFREDLFPAMNGCADHVTLYACEHDKALTASQTVHGWARAGQSATLGLRDLDSILVDLDDTRYDNVLALGHSYYGEVMNVLRDIREILSSRARPSDKPRCEFLKSVPDQGPPLYWRLAVKPGEHPGDASTSR